MAEESDQKEKKAKVGPRRKARECAVQLLFQFDFTRDEPTEILSRFWTMQRISSPNITRPAEFFFRQALLHRATVDAWIRKYSHNWPMDRLSGVDRNILRLAITEFIIKEEPNPAVIINEALEMARSFSGEPSVRFINGILDAVRIAILQEERPAESPLAD